MALFQPDRSLLFPQFETYKLHPLDADTDLSTYKLPGAGGTQSRVGYEASHLSFKEVRARIGWDHLAVSPPGFGSRGVYVDKDWGVVGFQLDTDLIPTFSKLADLPIPISSTEQQAEFPSVLGLTPSHWAVATGSGSLYVIQTSSPSETTFLGKISARYDLPSTPSSTSGSDSAKESESGSSPFLFRSSHMVSDNQVKVLATRSIRPKEGKSNISTAQLTRFELLEFTLDPSQANSVDDGVPEKLHINWRLEGGDLPIWTNWNESTEEWLILSAEQLRARNEEDDKPETDEERKKRERDEKMSKLGLGASLPSAESGEAGKDESMNVNPKADQQQAKDRDMTPDDKSYPYSWTQDAESVNISIPLPVGISREDLNLVLTPTTLTISLSPSANATPSPELTALLAKGTKSWWTNIDASSSTWALNNPKSGSGPVLEIDLAKADENTRWPSVFMPSSEYEESDDEDEDFDEVPETLSASTLAAVRETFSQIRTRDPNEGSGSGMGMNEPEPNGMHPAMPALLREEMDFDLDDDDDFGDGHEGVYSELGGGSGKVGREVFVGSIKDGTPKWSKSVTSVLSLPLSGSGTQTTPAPSSSKTTTPSGNANGVIVKSAVDGFLFQPTADGIQQPWEHISTNPALAFVISSKKDLRLVRHLTAAATSAPSAEIGGREEAEVHPHEGVEPASPSAAKRSKREFPPAPTSNGQAKQPIPTTTVLAFDSGSSMGQGNLYIYYPPSEGNKTRAKQGVIPVSGGERGALLGVGVVRVGLPSSTAAGTNRGERDVVVALCEKELVVLKGIL